MKHRLGLIVPALVFTGLTTWFRVRLEDYEIRNLPYLNPPPEQIEHFGFGFNESMADSLWLRWIQDGDVCQTYAGIRPARAITNDDDFKNPRHRVCDSSWSFKMLDATTRLAPLFEMPYKAGAMTLAVLVEDYEGATVLFDRAVKNFPDDWQMLYRAGYHFTFDVNDPGRAADLMQRAAAHGAPSWVNVLAARLYSKAGKARLGIETLERYRELLQTDEQRARIDRRIAELRRTEASEP